MEMASVVVHSQQDWFVRTTARMWYEDSGQPVMKQITSDIPVIKKSSLLSEIGRITGVGLYKNLNSLITNFKKEFKIPEYKLRSLL